MRRISKSLVGAGALASLELVGCHSDATTAPEEVVSCGPLPCHPHLADTAIYAPDPNRTDLAQTSTGRGRKNPGKVTIAYCVNLFGETTNIQVVRPFDSDPEIDAACVDAIRKWRFAPQPEHGEPLVACGKMTFAIRFDPPKRIGMPPPTRS